MKNNYSVDKTDYDQETILKIINKNHLSDGPNVRTNANTSA